MSKELVDGRELFDGEPVDFYEGKFTGAFILDEAAGAPMANGDLVTFIVTARVDTPKFGYLRKTGELKRSNNMKIVSVMNIDADRARFLYDTLGASVDGINEGIIEVVTPPRDAAEPEVELFTDTFFSNTGQELLAGDSDVN